MSQYRVADADRPVLWYAGYILGHICRNSHGLPYPDPPFGPDGVPCEDDELRRAIAQWQNPRVLACVADGQVIRELPPLHWIEEGSAPPSRSPSCTAGTTERASPNPGVPLESLKDTLRELLADMAAETDDPPEADDMYGYDDSWEDEGCEGAPGTSTSPAPTPVCTVPVGAAREPVPDRSDAPSAFGLATEGVVVYAKPKPKEGVLKRIETFRARVAKATAKREPTMRLTEGLLSFWQALTPARADLHKADPDPVTRDHELFKQHVLPEDQAPQFFAPELGPQTRQLLDVESAKADDAIRLEADILGQAALRSIRWQTILEEAVSAIEKDGAAKARTVSLDPVDLLEDLSAITQLNAYLFRQMQCRRLHKILKRFPVGSKARRPLEAYVSGNGVLGGSALENSARTLYQARKGPLPCRGARGRRRPFRAGSATARGVGRGSGSSVDAQTLSTILRSLASAPGGAYRRGRYSAAPGSFARGQPSYRRASRRSRGFRGSA